MSRIDSTYFVRERLLPLSSGAVGVPSARSTNKTNVLDDFITFYEREFLILILGADLYAEYIVDYQTDKWKDFDALMFNDTLKDSPVADYIYCKYWADHDTVTGDGTLRVNGDAKNRVSASERIIPVWNAMIKKVLPIIEYLVDNESVFCETYDYNWSGWKTFAFYADGELHGYYANAFGL